MERWGVGRILLTSMDRIQSRSPKRFPLKPGKEIGEECAGRYKEAISANCRRGGGISARRDAFASGVEYLGS